MTTSKMDAASSPGLRALAELVGVECDYVDGRGQAHQATDVTLRIILGALGLDVQSESDIQRERNKIQEERWTRVLEPVLLHYPETRMPLCFPIALPLEEVSSEEVAISFRLKDEQGKVRLFPVKVSACKFLENATNRGIRYVRMQVSLAGRLPLGYYDLMGTVMLGPRVLEVKSLVIAAPQRCYLPRAQRKNGASGCSYTVFVLRTIGALGTFVIWNES